MSNIFLRKTVEMFTINHILHEFRFFVNVFLRKFVKRVELSRKIVKMFKTAFIVANVAFFVKVISRKNAAATVARGPVPRETLNRAEMVPFYRSAGACPPRASELREKWPQSRTHGHFLSRSMHGEGQALALR